MAKKKSSNKITRSLFPDNQSLEANPDQLTVMPLIDITQERYLNYALSVITSRALPDVRDGMKPVQRRILYTMWQQRVTFDAKHRKCAKVVGDVMGSFHPHGDSSIYEALVRLSQNFAMRVQLIDGSGNFGSIDGDSAAAMRYTECRLQRISDEILMEIGQKTVHFRPNYDGTKFEPVVLPSRIPTLLINGATGIAVGMATNIPPHNPGEIIKALIKMLEAQLEGRELSNKQLCKYIKAPDFPTGGQILNSKEELINIYETGSGAVKLRGTWESGEITRTTKTIYITSIPYAVNKSQLIEKIADVVISRKMPLLLDIKDISTDDIRIQLDLKKDADEQKVLAYLFKNTPLQTNFNVNMTCLVPTENPEVGRPEKCDLHTMLWHFLHFRLEVVTKRLENELDGLNRRIHMLEGFETVFDALEEIIKLIRKSEGKADAAQKIMAKFNLTAEQTDAILELKLYRLAKLEILVVRKELEEKRKRARGIIKLLKNEDSRWNLIHNEFEQAYDTYGKPDKRRSLIQSTEDEVTFSSDDFIIDEDANVLITKDGWVKRQREIKDPNGSRIREGDAALACVAGSTRATIVFFSNFGTAYTIRIIDIPTTTGYGEPIQKFFKLKDGEKIITAYSLDPRVAKDIKVDPKKPDYAPLNHMIAASSDGFALRFGLEAFIEPSTKSGRRFAKLSKGATIIGTKLINGSETLIAASHDTRAILCPAEEVNYLSGPGKGVILIKLDKNDFLLGFIASKGERDLMTVITNRGASKNISTAKYEIHSRGGKGREIQKNGKLKEIIVKPIEAPDPLS